MNKIVAVVTLGIAAVPVIGAPVRPEAGQQPTFRASTELIRIETQVVSRDGKPISGLSADQFEVFIDGRRRPVVSIEFSQMTGRSPTDALRPVPPQPAQGVDGRIIVLGIDQASFPASARPSAQEAAIRVIDRVDANDYVGMIAFPGAGEVAPTRDRAPVRAAIKNIVGVRVEALAPRFKLSLSEAVALKSRESVTTREIIERECRSDFANASCPQEVTQEGIHMADTLEQQALLTIDGLHGVVDAMASLPGRKTLMLISAGLPMSSRPGSKLNLDTETARIARRAAAANINLYVLYMNVHFLGHFSAAYGKKAPSIFEDISLFGTGLEKFADSAGGTFFQVEVSSDPFVDRALRETSAYYVLGVQAQHGEHDDKDHFIRVVVKQKEASVRYRRIVRIPRSGRSG